MTGRLHTGNVVHAGVLVKKVIQMGIEYRVYRPICQRLSHRNPSYLTESGRVEEVTCQKCLAKLSK
jgi:hypothetical protein